MWSNPDKHKLQRIRTPAWSDYQHHTTTRAGSSREQVAEQANTEQIAGSNRTGSKRRGAANTIGDIEGLSIASGLTSTYFDCTLHISSSTASCVFIIPILFLMSPLDIIFFNYTHQQQRFDTAKQTSQNAAQRCFVGSKPTWQAEYETHGVCDSW